jgi:intracellular septation protein
MKTINKLFNNPILPIVLIAAVWIATKDFYYLTLSLMILVSLQVLLEKLALGKVSQMLFYSWCLLMPLGLLTVLLRDPLFLQWKFSIVNWLMGFVLIGSYWIKGPIVLRGLLSAADEKFKDIPKIIWKQLTYSISFFFIFIGTVNLYFIYFTSLETWVNFKIYVIPAMTFIMLASSLSYAFYKVESHIK